MPDAAAGRNPQRRERFAQRLADAALPRAGFGGRPNEDDAGACGGAEHHRSQRHDERRRRRTALLRQIGPGEHADILGVDLLLRAGLARAHQEGLVDVAACLRVAFEFAQTHHRLAVADRGLLERREIVGERLFAGFGAAIFGTRRNRGTVDLVVDHAMQPFGLRLNIDYRRMQRAKACRLLGFAAHDLGILAAQRGDGRRLQRCREGAVLVLAALDLFDLVETRLGIGGAGARRAELIVHIGELLVGHQLAVCGQKTVARLESLGLFLGFADAVLELLQASGQGLRHLPGGIGPHLRLFNEIGLGDGVG